MKKIDFRNGALLMYNFSDIKPVDNMRKKKKENNIC